MPPETKVRIEVHFVPLPPEKYEAYKAAIRWLWKLMREELEEQKKNQYALLICPECKCELHITTAGSKVCRNETCPNYS